MFLKGIITDLDGTLCDTMNANIESYRQAFKDAGVKFDESAYRNNFGLRFDQMMKKINPKMTSDQLGIIQKQKSIHYKNNTSMIKPNLLLIDFLKNAKSNGVKIAIATTAKKENALSVLNYFNILELFDEAIFAEDVVNGKPDPECYLKAISKLELKPSECLIFEDSEIGVEAAKKTNSSVIKVSI